MNRPSPIRSPKHAMLLATVLIALSLATGALGIDVNQSAGWPDGENDWSTYGGSNRQAAHTPTTGPMTTQQPIASAPLGSASFTAPVIDSLGYVYVGGDDGTVHKVHPNLTTVWTHKLPGPLRASLLIDEARGQIIAAPVHKELHALDIDDGEPRWTTTTDNTAPANEYVLTAAPAMHPSGFIVIGSMNGKIYGIDPQNGTENWTFTVDPSPARDGTQKVISSAAIGTDGTMYIGSQNNHLYALNADGTKKWSVQLDELATLTGGGQIDDEQVTGAASLDEDGTVYVGTSLRRNLVGAVYSFTDSGTQATERWVATHNGKVSSPVTIGPDAVYVGAQDGSFIAFDKADGNDLWVYTPGNALRSEASGQATSIFSVAEQAMLDGAGHLYVPYWHVDLGQGFPPQQSFPSPLVVLDATNGERLWHHVFNKTIRAPAMLPTTDTNADGAPEGIVYLAGDDGHIYAMGDAAIPPARGPPQPSLPPPAAEDDGNSDTNKTDDGNDTDDGNVLGNASNDDEGRMPGPTGLAVALSAAVVAAAIRKGHPRRRA